MAEVNGKSLSVGDGLGDLSSNGFKAVDSSEECRLPSTRSRMNKEFSCFLDRQKKLTELLDDMFHVKR